MSDPQVQALAAQIAALQRDVQLLRDEADIRRLQYRYGYYDELYCWDELLELFADGDCSVEIGARGKYIGKSRVARFYREIIGQNRTRLSKNQIYNHLQLQMVVTVDPSGERAQARSRTLVLGSRGDGVYLMLAEGVYENSYIKQGGQWKIQHMYWAPTFYARIDGLESLSFAGVPASTSFPPDEPARLPDPDVGRVLVEFHY